MANVRVVQPDGSLRIVFVAGDCQVAAQSLFDKGFTTAGCTEGSAVDDQPPPLNTALAEFSIFGAIGGALGGLLTGGPLGALAGALAGGADDTPPPVVGPSVQPSQFAEGGANCPPGTFQVGQGCVDILAAPIGGAPFIFPANGNGVSSSSTSAVGVASAPAVVARNVRRCARSHVLADLGNGVRCYHRKLIPNGLRLYPKPPRPALTARDKRMIKKYAKGGTKAQSIRELAKELGFKVTN